MKHTIRTAFTIAAAASLFSFGFLSSDAFAQTQEMIRRLQMQSQGGAIGQQTVDVPGMGAGTGQMRPSDLLPDELSLTYPVQSDILLDRQVDPESYILGPGDLVGVYLWGGLDRGYQLRVSPEGYLIIPSVGSIPVADNSIADARETLGESIHSNYPDVEYSLVLIEPRRFRLHVSGLVYVPGMHDSHALERVSDVLDRAGLILPGRVLDQVLSEAADAVEQQAQTQMQTSSGVIDNPELKAQPSKRISLIGAPRAGMLGRERIAGKPDMVSREELFTLGYEKGASIRSILIHRGDETMKADLLKFTKLGLLDANPYLNSGDHVEIMSYQGDISIFGEVNDAGVYEYNPGDRVCDLIGFGGGLSAQADSSEAELVRLAADGRSLNHISIDLSRAVYESPDSPEYLLKESDRIFVRRRKNAGTVANVEVRGQVKTPGVYPVISGVTTLQDIIRIAGGFTGNENLGQASLFRGADPFSTDLEYERLKTILYTDRNSSENDYIRSYQRNMPGTVNVDFISLFRDRDMSRDIILQDNDIIVIPRKSTQVNVIGAVMNPGIIEVCEGEDFRYYVEKSGGFNFEANKRGISVRKASTGQILLVMKEDFEIEGGDTMFVPIKARRTFWAYVTEYSTYLTMIGTLVVLGMQVSR